VLPKKFGWSCPFPAIREGQYGELDKRITDEWLAFSRLCAAAVARHRMDITLG